MLRLHQMMVITPDLYIFVPVYCVDWRRRNKEWNEPIDVKSNAGSTKFRLVAFIIWANNKHTSLKIVNLVSWSSTSYSSALHHNTLPPIISVSVLSVALRYMLYSSSKILHIQLEKWEILQRRHQWCWPLHPPRYRGGMIDLAGPLVYLCAYFDRRNSAILSLISSSQRSKMPYGNTKMIITKRQHT